MACPKYSHVVRYQRHRKKVGQNTAVLWPTPYSSSSDEVSPDSSWIACNPFVKDMILSAAGLSFVFFESRLSHLFG